MFFLGLLSTPLPYLLLAAFYFFGFAMGMFNNSTGEEPADAVSAVTIPAEVKQQIHETATFYYQVNSEISCNSIEIIQPTHQPETYPPDIRQQVFWDKNSVIPEIFLTGFRFSRPPPSVC